MRVDETGAPSSSMTSMRSKPMPRCAQKAASFSGLACAAVAEAKIVAADEVHGVVAPEQRLLREALPRLRHGLAVEMQREHLSMP